MLKTLRAHRAKKAEIKAQKAERLLRNEEPLFLMIGSMSGCSRKDVVNYARGLAQRYTSSLDSVWLNVQRDPIESRFNFEIQEGGQGYSLLSPILKQLELEPSQEIAIKLANNKQAIIEDSSGGLHSLVVPDVNEVQQTAGLSHSEWKGAPLKRVDELLDLLPKRKVMRPLISDNRWVMRVSYGLVVFSVLAVVIVHSAVVFWRGSLIDPLMLVRDQVERAQENIRNNPIPHLIEAKNEAKRKGGHISALRFRDGGWTWEVER